MSYDYDDNYYSEEYNDYCYYNYFYSEHNFADKTKKSNFELKLDFSYQVTTNSGNDGIVLFEDQLIDVGVREGGVTRSDAFRASVLGKNIIDFNNTLPDGHMVCMRLYFRDRYGTDSFSVDYIYDNDEEPLFTPDELKELLKDEYEGIIYMCDNVVFRQVDTKHPFFNKNSKIYYEP